jgi:hypothetical protein
MGQEKTSLAVLRQDFEEKLADVLIENAHGVAHRTRLFEARERLKAHPDLTSEQYAESVDRAFERFRIHMRVLEGPTYA